MKYQSTHYQKNILNMVQMYPNSSVGNAGGLIRYKEKFPYEAMVEGYRNMAIVHKAMRLRLSRDGSWYVSDEIPDTFLYYDCRHMSEEECIIMAESWFQEPMEIYDSVLYDIRYIDMGENGFSYAKFHHLIFDGACAVYVLQAHYRWGKMWMDGVKAKLEPEEAYLSLMKGDTIATEKLIEKAKNWYQERRWKDASEWKLKAPAKNAKAEKLFYEIPEKLMGKLRMYCKEAGVTYEAMLYGALYAYIFGQKKNKRAAIGRVMVNRNKKQFGIFGLFANTLPVFMEQEDETSTEFIKRISRDFFAIQKYAACSYSEQIMENNNTEIPYDISVSYRIKSLYPIMEECQGEELFSGSSEVPLRIFAEELDEELYISLQYQCECYKKEEIDMIFLRLCYLMEQITENRKMNTLSLITKEDKKNIEQYNQVMQYEYTMSVLEQIEAQMIKIPDSDAVCFGTDSITYGELRDRMNRVASYLKQHGVQKGQIVSICMDRSLWLTAVMLGIWKCGAAFLTISTNESVERKKKLAAISVYCVTESDIDSIRLQTPLMEEMMPDGNDAAYLMYTSGTTGEPKAPILTHKSLALRLRWMVDEYGCGHRVLQKTTYTFDVSVWEFFLPLMEGRISCMLEPGAEKYPAKIADAIEKQNIETIHFVPSMLQIFVEEAKRKKKQYPQVKLLVCSGEVLTKGLFTEAAKVFPKSQIANLYGPTECTIDVTHELCEIKEEEVTIGRPVANTALYIVNTERQMLPPGIAGEICITGDLVGEGYYGKQSDAFGVFEGKKAYFTGDYGVLGFDGRLRYQGRKDRQYKLRGIRIDLYSLEEVMMSHPNIKRVVVRTEKNHIEACYEADKEIADLKKWLLQRIPPHLLPSCIYHLDTFSYQENGKLKEAMLWKQAEEKSMLLMQQMESIYPVTEKEELIRDIVCKVMGFSSIAVNESLLDAGLDSISILNILTELDKRGIKLRYEDFYENSTIQELAKSESTESEVLTLLKEGKNKGARRLICVPYAAGSPYLYYSMSQDAAFEDYEIWAVTTAGYEDKTAEWIAERVVEFLEVEKDNRNYDILGYCVGSAIAVLIAECLEKKNKTIQLCLMTSLPEKGLLFRGNVYSYWDMVSDSRIKSVMEHLQGKRQKWTKGMVRQFRCDVKRFLEFMNQRDCVPIKGKCSFIFAEKDIFTAGSFVRWKRWKRYLKKEKIVCHYLKKGGHFFLQTEKEIAKKIISETLNEK